MKNITLLGLSLLLGCTGGGIITREIRGQSPVARLSIVDGLTEGRSIALYLEAEADWQALVNLESFQGFDPTMSHEDARGRVGPPDQILGSRYIYNRPLGRVEVEHVVDRSGREVFEQWQVRSFPARNELSTVFSSELADQIAPHLLERSELVLIHPSEYGPALRVQMSGMLIESMVWYHD